MQPSEDIISAAQSSEQTWGIPASITIAQWALESGWGQHMPPGSNNPFGIKATGDQPFVVASTREVINGRSVIVDANFRSFDSISEAFDAHAKLLATSPAYAAARMYESNPTAFANALTGIYATDPSYGSLLNSIIQASNLLQYDKTPEVGAAMIAVDGVAGAHGAASNNPTLETLIGIASDPSQLQNAQRLAAQRLLAYDGEKYPTDGCAITLSVLLQEAGFALADTFQALKLGAVLEDHGWARLSVGAQQRGDVGSTCGDEADHGYDHIYLVLQEMNANEMVVADNQEPTPHFRFASGTGGKTPTKFFLRMPTA